MKFRRMLSVQDRSPETLKEIAQDRLLHHLREEITFLRTQNLRLIENLAGLEE